jgi:hypothetical protein
VWVCALLSFLSQSPPSSSPLCHHHLTLWPKSFPWFHTCSHMLQTRAVLHSPSECVPIPTSQPQPSLNFAPPNMLSGHHVRTSKVTHSRSPTGVRTVLQLPPCPRYRIPVTPPRYPLSSQLHHQTPSPPLPPFSRPSPRLLHLYAVRVARQHDSRTQNVHGSTPIRHPISHPPSCALLIPWLASVLPAKMVLPLLLYACFILSVSTQSNSSTASTSTITPNITVIAKSCESRGWTSDTG